MSSKTFDPGRISALSDGVFAIAMTLLVLNLQAPGMARALDPSTFARVLVGQFPGFVSWLLSFAILCRLWIVHHDLLVDGDTRSNRFLAWNFVFLGAVSFIPFPTALLAEHPEQLLSVVIFSSTYVVAGLALGRMRHVNEEEITSEHAAPALMRACSFWRRRSCRVCSPLPNRGSGPFFGSATRSREVSFVSVVGEPLPGEADRHE